MYSNKTPGVINLHNLHTRAQGMTTQLPTWLATNLIHDRDSLKSVSPLARRHYWLTSCLTSEISKEQQIQPHQRPILAQDTGRALTQPWQKATHTFLQSWNQGEKKGHWPTKGVGKILKRSSITPDRSDWPATNITFSSPQFTLSTFWLLPYSALSQFWR